MCQMSVGTVKSSLGVPTAPGFVVGKNKNAEACLGTIEVFQMAFFLKNIRVCVARASSYQQ